MREKIEETIIKAGLSVDEFIIGYGTKSPKSLINYNPDKSEYLGDTRKKYSVQFYKEVIALYEIGRRIELNASIQLDMGNMTWDSINEPIEKSFRIQGTDECSKAAVMPFCFFEYYLLSTYGSYDSEEVYKIHKEGNKIQFYATRYERNSALRSEAIRIHGTDCMICGFSFEDKYGDIGKNFIEVHHIYPVSAGKRECNPETDLVCVCSNCHRMIHRKRDKVIPVDEMRRIVSMR